MSNQEFINSNRPAAEARITRRLNTSRWFARGMFVLGLAGGSVAATGGHNNYPEFLSGFGAGVAACVAAPLERRYARRSLESTISDYAQQAGAYGNGNFVTVLSVKDGELHERTEFDRTISSIFDAGSTVASTSMGWLGSFVAVRALDGEALKRATTSLEVFGGLFVSLGAVMLSVDNLSVREETQNSLRRLDNIDNSIRFEE